MDQKISECLQLLKEESEHMEHHDDDHHHHLVRLGYHIWIYGCVSIIIISLCGIFGVLVIPVMQKVFYQYLIQFLIALAIGSMLGDAFLHLIPHALSLRSHDGNHTHDHSNDDHDGEHSKQVWTGFVGLMALIVFFILEKLINVFGEWKESRKNHVKEKELQIIRSGHKASNRAIGEKVCMHKYSAYCVSDFENDVQEVSSKVNPENENESNAKNIPLLSLSGKIERMDDLKEESLQVANHASLDCVSASGTVPSFEGWRAVFIREHEHSHHGHSHAHSHLHSAPDSITSVAWMVIVGDGIHNLADGMAVGAAFTEDFISGLSTSIAVLCHELPHEVGDFAMLLKAGMSLKQALFYNILSSFLAFVGMIVGILLGNIEHFTPWIFMGTAGVFMYVALVDMMPELNSGHTHPLTSREQREGRSFEFASQILGLCLGISIMLVIALFEDRLENVFTS